MFPLKIVDQKKHLIETAQLKISGHIPRWPDKVF